MNLLLNVLSTAKKINERLLDYQILGGYDLAKVYPKLKNHLLMAVTEMNSMEEIDYLVNSLAEVSHD